MKWGKSRWATISTAGDRFLTVRLAFTWIGLKNNKSQKVDVEKGGKG